MKLIDKPITEIWKKINRIYRTTKASRYFDFKHPDKYKQRYTKYNKIKQKNYKLKKCKCGCGQRTYHNYARGHYSRIFHPSTQDYVKLKLKGINHHNWKGGKIIRDGYLYIYKPNHPNATKAGYVLKHRLVKEHQLKRYLTKNEIVHHNDGNKLNNNENNLKLFKNINKHSTQHYIDRSKDDTNGRFVSEVRLK